LYLTNSLWVKKLLVITVACRVVAAADRVWFFSCFHAIELHDLTTFRWLNLVSTCVSFVWDFGGLTCLKKFGVLC